MTSLLTQDIELTGELELQDWYRRSGFTDGLPVIVPTVERVEEFIRNSRFERTRRVGMIEPALGLATVESVAVNALMAGCRPEYLGVVLGALDAMTKSRFNLRGVQTTTNPVAPLTIVNGPVGQELGIDSGGHALGGGPYPNGVIGRGIRLALRNIGGVDVEVSQATLASTARYTFCLAEAEGSSPWEPFHVSLGYDAEQSVVTAVGVESVVNVVAHMWSDPEDMIGQFVHTMRAIGANVLCGQGTLVWVLNPAHARFLAQAGYTRQALQERFFEATKFTPEAWPFADTTGTRKLGNIQDAHGWSAEDGKVRITERASDIYVLVGGRDHPIHSTYMTAMPYSESTSAAVWQPDR
jgi:hypothetical protein